ncbi:hypothetical protein, partial [Pseudovibrio sp. WM33]|uniref:hypothetical protein n=1 Tax=Pseudovibrio sp. WM33 TaxID=1735585 RepID=UPI001AD8FEFA
MDLVSGFLVFAAIKHGPAILTQRLKLSKDAISVSIIDPVIGVFEQLSLGRYLLPAPCVLFFICVRDLTLLLIQSIQFSEYWAGSGKLESLLIR